MSNKIIFISLLAVLSVAHIITPFVFAQDVLEQEYCCIMKEYRSCGSVECIQKKAIITCQVLGWQGLFEEYVDKNKLGHTSVKNSYSTELKKEKIIYDLLTLFQSNQSLNFIKNLTPEERLELLIKTEIKCDLKKAKIDSINWLSDLNALYNWLKTKVIGCSSSSKINCISDCKKSISDCKKILKNK
ncbi:MAG: hypothetical protein AB7U45_06225 [Desulfamplus sp.]